MPTDMAATGLRMGIAVIFGMGEQRATTPHNAPDSDARHSQSLGQGAHLQQRAGARLGVLGVLGGHAQKTLSLFRPCAQQSGVWLR